MFSGLYLDRLADFRQEQCLPGGARRIQRGCLIDLDRWKSIVMNADNFGGVDKFRRAQRIVDSHGKKIANWKNSEVQFRFLTNKFHVVGEGGVSGIIKIPVVR